MPHAKMYEDSVPARAMWPTLSNRNGVNSFPRLVDNPDEGEFPFEKAPFSSFCLDVFDNGLCNSYDSLTLTYDDGTSIFLGGMPQEYCAFTCGTCQMPENDVSLESCFQDHNNIMNTLSSQNSIATDYAWWDSGESESNYFDYDQESEESSESSEESEEDYEHAWDYWGRKRRAVSPVSLEKREIIVSAIESILSGKNARTRRSGFDWDWGVVEESNPLPTENLAEKLADCNGRLLNQDDSVEVESIEVTEEEEEDLNPLLDVVERRQPKDFAGIQQYFNQNSVNLQVDNDQCEWVEFTPEGEIEDFAGLELMYDCPVSCPEGHSLKISDELEEGVTEIRVNCSKDKKQGTNMLRDSICEGALYCPNGVCQKIECVEDEVEEPVEDSLDWW